MSNVIDCPGAGQRAQLHSEDEIVRKRRCLECGAALDIIPRKPKGGEGLTAGYTAIAILPPHRAHT